VDIGFRLVRQQRDRCLEIGDGLGIIPASDTPDPTNDVDAIPALDSQIISKRPLQVVLGLLELAELSLGKPPMDIEPAECGALPETGGQAGLGLARSIRLEGADGEVIPGPEVIRFEPEGLVEMTARLRQFTPPEALVTQEELVDGIGWPVGRRLVALV